jgi:hypothetical protein
LAEKLVDVCGPSGIDLLACASLRREDNQQEALFLLSAKVLFREFPEFLERIIVQTDNRNIVRPGHVGPPVM